MKKFSLCLLIGLIAMVGCKKYEYDSERTLQTKTARLVNEWSPYAYYENGVEKTTYARFDLTVKKNSRKSQMAWIDYGTGPLEVYGVGWEFLNHGNDLRFNYSDGSSKEYSILRLEQDTLWIRTKNSSENLEFHFASR